jgi:hypothetical protein
LEHRKGEVIENYVGEGGRGLITMGLAYRKLEGFKLDVISYF